VGAFEVEGGPEPCPWLDAVEEASGFIALSHFVPAAGDPVEGRWRQHVSFPKYQGDAVAHPFKGTLLSLTPGSVFCTGAPPRPFYGRMIPFPAAELPQALHYGLCFAAPARVGRLPGRGVKRPSG
jgi:hypothetical protein